MSEVRTYYQADEPSDTTPSTIWNRTDGTRAQRGFSGEWIEKGSWSLEDDGYLPIAGGTVDGPVLGNHGHATTDNPTFTGTMTLNGEEVPDKPWVIERLEAMQQSIQTWITSMIGGDGGNITIGNNLVIACGTVNHGSAIPLPKYADNTRATVAQVKGVMVGYRDQKLRDNPHGYRFYAYHDPTTLVVTCQTVLVETNGNPAGSNVASSVNYLIICSR